MMLVILVVADIALLECNYSTFLFYLLVLLALMIQSNFCWDWILLEIKMTTTQSLITGDIAWWKPWQPPPPPTPKQPAAEFLLSLILFWCLVLLVMEHNSRVQRTTRHKADHTPRHTTSHQSTTATTTTARTASTVIAIAAIVILEVLVVDQHRSHSHEERTTGGAGATDINTNTNARQPPPRPEPLPALVLLQLLLYSGGAQQRRQPWQETAGATKWQPAQQLGNMILAILVIVVVVLLSVGAQAEPQSLVEDNRNFTGSAVWV